MLGKTMQVVGVLALVAWTAVGAVAWYLTKEQVSVTVSEGPGEARRAVDPHAALRDEIARLAGDVRALRDACANGLRDIADHATEAAAQDAAARSSMTAAVRALREEVAELDTRLVLALQRAHEPTVAVVAPRESAGSRPGSVPDSTLNRAASLPATAAPPRGKRPFLAFDLPSDRAPLAGRQRFTVLPDLSRVGFDAKSTLHDFTGASTNVRGELEADFAHPEAAPTGTLRVEVKGLDTGLVDRNAAMLEHLDAAHHATVAFTLTAFSAERVDAARGEIAGTVTGTLTVRGVTRRLDMPVRVRVDASARICVDGEAPLRLTDFAIPVPSKLGLISMQDEVKIWIALRLRAAGKVQ